MTMGPSSPAVLRVTRVAAVAITAAIGVGSFVLSFAALRDLAARAGWPPNLASVWPLIVDGAILMATMAVVALAPYSDRDRDRRFFWAVLVASAAVSIGGNALHAVIPKGVPLSSWLAAAIAMVPPVMLLASTHGLSLLARVRAQEVEVAADVSVLPEHIAAEPIPRPVQQREEPADRWSALTAAITEGDAVEGVEPSAVTDVLRLTFERGLPNRSIARQLDIEPRTVAKIVTAGERVLQSRVVTADAS
ncbi:DUF2637 domain-containing protein [Mycolicibacterium sp. XJ870]